VLGLRKKLNQQQRFTKGYIPEAPFELLSIHIINEFPLLFTSNLKVQVKYIQEIRKF